MTRSRPTVCGGGGAELRGGRDLSGDRAEHGVDGLRVAAEARVGRLSYQVTHEAAHRATRAAGERLHLVMLLLVLLRRDRRHRPARRHGRHRVEVQPTVALGEESIEVHATHARADVGANVCQARGVGGHGLCEHVHDQGLASAHVPMDVETPRCGHRWRRWRQACARRQRGGGTRCRVRRRQAAARLAARLGLGGRGDTLAAGGGGAQPGAPEGVLLLRLTQAGEVGPHRGERRGRRPLLGHRTLCQQLWRGVAGARGIAGALT
eukprot:scaffold12080_cov67-Phaeocystis_antarctica.AAC.2